jgi:predicted phosphodiesterase
MKLAIIADVHANLRALAAVTAEIEATGVDQVVCLGDLVGYNAEPSESLAQVRVIADIAVAGNHDRDTVSSEPDLGTNTDARSAQIWTRNQLREDELAYLAELPSHVVDFRGFVAAHGCYLSETYVTGYVTSTMLEANLRAVASKNEWPGVALCGHTHSPLCGWLEGDKVVEAQTEEPIHWPSAASTVLINPGSVGQPRDRDPRAAFAVLDLDDRCVEIKRVPYDVEGAARAIRAAGLPPSLADRLSEGR